MITEHQFRKLCRSNNGGLESRIFEDALNDYPELELIPIKLVFGQKPIHLRRELVQRFSDISKEERKEEDELLKYVKPQLHTHIIMNRGQFIERLKKGLEKYHPEHNGVTIVWETNTPDKVPYEIVNNYLRKYGG